MIIEVNLNNLRLLKIISFNNTLKRFLKKIPKGLYKKGNLFRIICRWPAGCAAG